jgi:hypothetical protein
MYTGQLETVVEEENDGEEDGIEAMEILITHILCCSSCFFLQIFIEHLLWCKQTDYSFRISVCYGYTRSITVVTTSNLHIH